MRIAIVKERHPFEKRVAATPETVKKLRALGFDVAVERDAGLAASFTDQDYQQAGADVQGTFSKAVEKADIVLKVQSPLMNDATAVKKRDELEQIPQGATLIGLLSPSTQRDQLQRYADRGLNTFSLELVPRITRAQSMDVLSSQSNLAGYRAVIEAATLFGRAFPMMMTAAGTIPPARVLIIGAGVAGLQAIATARRLGAIVSAFDVRAAAKEQVESLGATFIDVSSDEKGEGSGGYAKEMTADYQHRQAALLTETLKKTDIVITTALIPGKPAPRLITAAMIDGLKPGSVVVDMAVESGGNVEGSQKGDVIERHGVQVCGYANLPSRIARDASALYARNVFNFLTLLVQKENKDSADFTFNFEDDIMKAALLTRQGHIVHPSFQPNAGGSTDGH